MVDRSPTKRNSCKNKKQAQKRGLQKTKNKTVFSFTILYLSLFISCTFSKLSRFTKQTSITYSYRDITRVLDILLCVRMYRRK